MTETFRKGQRVLYSGPVLYLNGQAGTVHSVSRKGWVYVDFRQAFKVACAQAHLKPVSKADSAVQP